MENRECLACNNVFAINENDLRQLKKRFCSIQCYERLYRRKLRIEGAKLHSLTDNPYLNPANRVIKVCVVCGKPSSTRVHPGECEELDRVL